MMVFDICLFFLIDSPTEAFMQSEKNEKYYDWLEHPPKQILELNSVFANDSFQFKSCFTSLFYTAVNPF